jgi:hypothetical protein
MTRTPRAWLVLLPVALCLLAPAASPTDSPDDLIRRANAAFLAGDRAAAADLYAAAEELTADPGLVSFNRAAVAFHNGDFRGAELHYTRVLEDAACPPERAARAWYNRGTCLLRRGGGTSVYRSAIACFEHCLDSSAADDPLKADARYNLELAKTLWNDARKNDKRPDRPNENPPPEDQDAPPPSTSPAGTEQQPGTSEDGAGTGGQQATQPVVQPNQVGNPKAQPDGPETPVPGSGAPPLLDQSTPQKLDPEDTRRHLRDTDARLREERLNLLRAIRREPKPGARDW